VRYLVKVLLLLALALASVVALGQNVTRAQVNGIVSSKNPGLWADLEGALGSLNLTGFWTTGQQGTAMTNNSSTFAGWGTPAGPPARSSFNTIDVGINAWDKGNMPTLVRAQVLPTFTVVGATNATPIVIQYTASTAVGIPSISTNDIVRICNVAGNTAANGTWTVTKLDAAHFSLNSSTGNGAYLNGGSAVDTNIVLGDGFANLAGITYNTDTIVRVPLNRPVTDTSDNLYVQYVTDGHTGRFPLASLTLYPSTTYAQSSYTTTMGVLTVPTAWTVDGSQTCQYVRFGMGPVLSSFDNGTLSTTALQYGASTLSAYGGPQGTQKAFNRAYFDVSGTTTSNSSMASSFRCRIRVNSSTGAILADKVIQNVNLSPGIGKRIRFDFGGIVSGGSNNLWVELIGNNPFGIRMLAANAYPTGSGYAQAQYQTTNSIDGTTWNNNGTQYTPYCRLETVDYTLYSTNGTEDTKYAIQMAALSSTAPQLMIPSQLYAVSGGPEVWLQWDNVCTNGYGTGPAEGFYGFSTTWPKASQYSQGLLYQPLSTDSGTYSVPITVWHGGQPWQTVTSTMNLCLPTNGNGTTRKVLIIGDSTTAAGFYQAQAKRLFDTGGGLAITWLGTKSQTVNAADGTAETVNNEGIAGQTAIWFYSNVSSPFYYAGGFNFSTYMSTNSYSMTTNDWVIINLKINDEFNYSTDAAVQAAITQRLAAINAMITSIRTYNSGIRIGILAGIPPYRTQNGFAYLYGITSNIARYRYRRNWELMEKADLAYWDTSANVSNKIYYLPFGSNWDSANNQATTNTVALTVTGATNASPIVVTVNAPCQIVTGDSVTISGVLGNTAANGTFTVTQRSTTTFSLNLTTGNGAYSSGGTATVPWHKNMRNGTQATTEANSVHPASIGYYQLGDQLYSALLNIG